MAEHLQNMDSVNLNGQLKHLAIIMDGNSTWAKMRGKSSQYGHRRGFDVLLDSMDDFLEMEIPYVSLYAFSTENWKRNKSEIDFLFNMFDRKFEKHILTLQEKGVRVHFSGCMDRLRSSTINVINQVLKMTKNNDKLFVNICFNYGSREEIIQACKKWAMMLPLDLEERSSKINNFSEKEFSDYLYTAYFPDVDFLIRTGGEQRISNFLLYQLSYAELYFTDIQWPDWTTEDLKNAVNEFCGRCRKFGGRNV